MPDPGVLLSTARWAIEHGIENRHQPPRFELAGLDGGLIRHGASFVSLHAGRDLRGCIGTLEAHRPLIIDVTQNACNAAFRDPRFLPLEAAELSSVDIEISLLREATRMTVSSESDLIAQIRPGIDGLILKEGHQRGTFLPVVWEALPSVQQFLQELKRKAGLPSNYWSDTLEVWRYETELIKES